MNHMKLLNNLCTGFLIIALKQAFIIFLTSEPSLIFFDLRRADVDGFNFPILFKVEIAMKISILLCFFIRFFPIIIFYSFLIFKI